MKKILIAVMAVALVAGLTGGAFAYFSDTETATANEFGAGTLDLDWQSGDKGGEFIMQLSSKAPGQSGSASQTIDNAGNMAGEFELSIGAISDNFVGGGTEYEDVTNDLKSSALCTMTMYIDIDQSGTWTTGDHNLIHDGTVVTHTGAQTLDYNTFANYESTAWDGTDIYLMGAGDSDDVIFAWDIDSTETNDIQGDGVSFTVTMTLEQAEAD